MWAIQPDLWRSQMLDEGIIYPSMTKHGSKGYIFDLLVLPELLLTLGKERVPSEPLFISSSTNITAASFARLCQASHLLGHVLTHLNDHRSSPNFKLEEAGQLCRALLALCSFLQPEISSEATKICVPLGVCYRQGPAPPRSAN